MIKFAAALSLLAALIAAPAFAAEQADHSAHHADAAPPAAAGAAAPAQPSGCPMMSGAKTQTPPNAAPDAGKKPGAMMKGDGAMMNPKAMGCMNGGPDAQHDTPAPKKP